MSRQKIFLIIGKSFSGKDTLLNALLEDKEFCQETHLDKIVRYTNRAKRPHEFDGEDYFFITNEECMDMDYTIQYEADGFADIVIKEKDNHISRTSFKSEFGYLHYITDFSKLDPKKNYIVAGDPGMIESYKRVVGHDLCVIYLIPPDWALFERFSQRNDNDAYSSKKYKEIQRRYIDDLKKFGVSNYFLANTTCIINVGKEVDLDKIKENMKYFISGNISSIILNRYRDLIFNNDYLDDGRSEYTMMESVLRGNIILRNGEIVVHTEEETFDASID